MWGGGGAAENTDGCRRHWERLITGAENTAELILIDGLEIISKQKI